MADLGSSYDSGIYVITNLLNAKKYIGSAVNLKRRKEEHFSSLRNHSHFNRHLQSAWNKYEGENFRFRPLLYSNKENLLFYEQRAIDVYGMANLYNISSIAGSILGVKFTEEVKRKLSESHKGQLAWNKGKTGIYSEETRRKLSEASKGNINMKGHPHTKASRRKISESLKGRVAWNKGMPASEEAKKKMSESTRGEKHPNYGKHLSEETKLKISEKNKGKKISEKTKRKLSQLNKREKHPNWGKHRSEETKRKISQQNSGEKHPNYGKYLSIETRQKLSEAAKKDWIKRKGLEEN